MNPPKVSILLIYTGGTIGMKTNSDGALSPFNFNEVYTEFPFLHTLSAEIRLANFTPIDSSNVTPALWVSLAELIAANYDDFDSFVILHGTDTMAYTASALSFMLENLTKPVIFTGSQIPMGVLRTDGRENLITALEIASAREHGRAVVPEVSIYFQNSLFRANRTTKYSAEALGAFHSENYPPLAEVGVTIHYNYPYIYRYPSPEPLSQGSSPAPLLTHSTEPTEPLRIHTRLDDRVIVVRLFPGMRPDMFEAMLQLEGIRAVVLETYGSGNAPTAPWFINAVRDAIARGVILLNVTQCSAGNVSMERYETGRLLHQAGVISGADMTTESAVTKLMVLLGQTEDRNELSRQLKISVRGEFTR